MGGGGGNFLALKQKEDWKKIKRRAHKVATSFKRGTGKAKINFS